MKKSLIALAVLAASGASMAQVTLYGVADVAIGAADKVVAGSNFSLANTNAQLVTNGNYTNGNSRWGIKGTEDLGGGLKVGFQFEGSVDILTGANKGSGDKLFSRTAALTLSGGFGSFSAGRQYTPSFNAQATWDLTGAANYSAAQNQFGATTRDNAMLMYTTPDMGGFSVMAALVPQGNQQYGTAANPNSKYDIAGIYSQGPVNASLAYSKVDQGDQMTTLGGSYNFGPVSVAASWTSLKADSGDKKNEGYTLGASVPVGPWSFTLDVANTTTGSQLLAGNSNDSDVVFEVVYHLSKRTMVYGWLAKDGKGKTTDDLNAYAIGMRHNF
jgi:predicted porin